MPGRRRTGDREGEPAWELPQGGGNSAIAGATCDRVAASGVYVLILRVLAKWRIAEGAVIWMAGRRDRWQDNVQFGAAPSPRRVEGSRLADTLDKFEHRLAS